MISDRAEPLGATAKGSARDGDVVEAFIDPTLEDAKDFLLGDMGGCGLAGARMALS